MQLNVLTPEQQKQMERRSAEVDVDGLMNELRRHVDGEIRFDDGSRAIYATDASNYRQPPIGVVIPRTTEALVAAVGACHRYNAPITARGGGTSLAGQCCNFAVILDCSKYLTNILDVDGASRTARVQPGVILDQLNKRTIKEHQLGFGPDPSTHGWCTFGGMIGNNACGVHSVLAGRTVDNVEEMEVLTYDGVRMRVGRTPDDEIERIVREGGRRGEIYAGMRDIRDEHADHIRARYPNIPRRISGYNLDELLPEHGFNVARALVGTEGTCACILDATVRLVPYAPYRALVILGYPSVYEAGDHICEIMEYEPVGLEGMDQKLIDFLEFKHMHLEHVGILPDGDGWLMVEFGGATQDEADERAQQMMKALGSEPNPPKMKFYHDPKEESKVWEVRESALGATAFVPEMHDTWPGWEDAAVEPAQLGDYLRDFRKLLEKHDYDCALYGHFGQACVHCRITFDFRTQSGIARYRHFIEEASDLVMRYNGSFSAEHGDGQARAALLPKMYGSELVEAFRRFKELWDPDWKMNPGKVIDPYPPDANLRLGTDYAPWEPKTHYTYTQDNGMFSRAALRCVGVGKCRRREDAFMCPSYLATNEEKDTTRGRARILFEMVHGEVIADGWKSDAVMEALDLCLGCKGCKRDCPVDVDMATYKSEFLAHHFEGRLRPRDHYAMGLIGRWARLASLAPWAANFFAQTPGFSSVAKWAAGVHPKRRLPPFAGETFTSWFKRREPGRMRGQLVVVYPDVFNDHFFPDTLKACVHALEKLGYRVELPPGRVHAIRPLLHYGMLDRAKKQLKEEIELLHEIARAGHPIITLEPSTASVFREDLPNLFPADLDGHRVTENFKLLTEFLDEAQIDLPQLNRSAVLHLHCHEKAVLNPDAARKVLNAMNVRFDEPNPGCCGMAGSFGFERDHYDIAMKIGEDTLFPAVRDSDRDALIIVQGFSCREQIEDGAGRKPLHVAEVIDMAFDGTERNNERTLDQR